MRALLTISVLALLLPACAGPFGSGPWPDSSDRPVSGLDHPSLDARLLVVGPGAERAHRLVAFGDQRALADGEWQRMIAAIVAREGELQEAPPLLSVLDTGDVVDDGRHSDQFWMLAEILSPLRRWPYLVGVGNHEVHDNRARRARENFARFVRPVVGEEVGAGRLYHRADVGNHRLLFLDSNDFVYGDEGEGSGPGARGREQLRWLVEQLDAPRPVDEWTTVIIHHPFVISSTKHAGHAARLWSLRHDGRTLPQILLEGGVDLVLAGHTHTYERFELGRGEGKTLHLVNVSGRPRGVFLGLGAGGRRARDIAGHEVDDLRERGWTDLEGWRIEQRGAMIDDEANQWLELRFLDSGRRVEGEVFFLPPGGGQARSSSSFVFTGRSSR